MKSHGVAVGIGEGEGETEGSIKRCDQDRDSGENHCVVQILRIVRASARWRPPPPEVLDKPQDRSSGSRIANVMVSVAKTTAVKSRTHRSTDEAKVLGVEGCGSLQIANLERDEVWAECGHWVSISWSRIS